MNQKLRDYIDELYAEGRAFDGAEPDWSLRRRNIDPSVGEFLWIFLRALRSRSVVEIGTSNGYSTIWIADAVHLNGGRVTSVDYDQQWLDQGKANLAKAGLIESVDLECVNGGALLSGLPDDSIDFLFLDAERSDYAGWWPQPKRVLRSGGVMVVDNSLSHPLEIAGLYDQIRSDGCFSSTVVAVGKGELVAVKE